MRKAMYWLRLRGLVVLVVGTLTLLSGCGNLFGEEEEENKDSGDNASGTGELSYDGQTIELTQLWFNDLGQRDAGVYNIDIWIGSDDVDDPRDGIGNVVFLYLLFDTPSVSAGTYTYTVCQFSPLDLNAGTFCDDSAIYIGAETGDTLTGGTVTIGINGSEYTVDGDVTTSAGLTVEFSYVGALTDNL